MRKLEKKRVKIKLNQCTIKLLLACEVSPVNSPPVNSPYTQFWPKIGCHGNVPGEIGKSVQIHHLRTNTYHLPLKNREIGPIDPDIILVSNKS